MLERKEPQSADAGSFTVPGFDALREKQDN